MVEYAGLAGSITVPAEFTPLYRRVMADLREKIRTGEWPPGHRLPSTRDLAAAYDVAPGTIREAVNRLIETGELRGHQGLGVFVPDS